MADGSVGARSSKSARTLNRNGCRPESIRIVVDAAISRVAGWALKAHAARDSPHWKTVRYIVTGTIVFRFTHRLRWANVENVAFGEAPGAPGLIERAPADVAPGGIAVWALKAYAARDFRDAIQRIITATIVLRSAHQLRRAHARTQN